MSMEFAGRTTVVTGGASGMGRATTFLIARRGGRVLVGDVDRARGEEFAKEAAAETLPIEFLHLDLTKPDSVDTFADAARERLGAIDGLVNTAGWNRAEPFLQNTPEFWETIMTINLMGPVRLTHRLLPALIDSGRGRVVNVSSDAGRVGSSGDSVYAAAKGGLISFTKSLAREMAKNNVHVNCVCPGPTDTPLFRQQPENLRDALVKPIPLRRLGKPEEVAEVLAFFAGPRSEYVTGQVLSVSGGLTMVG
jgi:2-hydroxycyclohexanecarboxyl-CoA dehydrogenase